MKGHVSFIGKELSGGRVKPVIQVNMESGSEIMFEADGYFTSEKECSSFMFWLYDLLTDKMNQKDIKDTRLNKNIYKTKESEKSLHGKKSGR